MARILLVDDELELLETVGVLLKSEGHEVVALSDGMMAIDHLQSLEDLDIMVVDLRMAPVDGLEVIAVARKERPGMDIVVLSAYIDDAMLRKLTAMGIKICIKKPFSVGEVVDPIRELVLRRTRGGSRIEGESARRNPDEPKSPGETHEGWVL